MGPMLNLALLRTANDFPRNVQSWTLLEGRSNDTTEEVKLFNRKSWLTDYMERQKVTLHQDLGRQHKPTVDTSQLPGQGWWESRRALNRYDSEARYSLIVSLHVPETDVDLLTPVQFKVDALIASQIEIPS